MGDIKVGPTGTWSGAMGGTGAAGAIGVMGAMGATEATGDARGISAELGLVPKMGLGFAGIGRSRPGGSWIFWTSLPDRIMPEPKM